MVVNGQTLTAAIESKDYHPLERSNLRRLLRSIYAEFDRAKEVFTAMRRNGMPTALERLIEPLPGDLKAAVLEAWKNEDIPHDENDSLYRLMGAADPVRPLF